MKKNVTSKILLSMGNSVGDLEMWTYVNSSWKKLWNSTSKMNEWQHGKVYIGNLLGALEKGWEVQFEALPDSASLGINDILAIDV